MLFIGCKNNDFFRALRIKSKHCHCYVSNDRKNKYFKSLYDTSIYWQLSKSDTSRFYSVFITRNSVPLKNAPIQMFASVNKKWFCIIIFIYTNMISENFKFLTKNVIATTETVDATDTRTKNKLKIIYISWILCIFWVIKIFL